MNTMQKEIRDEGRAIAKAEAAFLAKPKLKPLPECWKAYIQKSNAGGSWAVCTNNGILIGEIYGPTEEEAMSRLVAHMQRHIK